MASIFKRPKSPYWHCEFRGGDGRWHKRSTKLKDRQKADLWCKALQAAEDEIRGGDPSEVQLRGIIDSAMERITGKKLAPTVRQWLGQWLAGKVGANAAGTMVRYRQSVKDFLSFLGPRADSRLESIDQRDVLAFRDFLLQQGKSATTANLTIGKIVGASFRLAFNQGIIRHNPAILPRLKEIGRRRKQPFTIEQVRSLLAATDGQWRGAVTLAYTSGMRLSDLANLQWENIDFENSVIHFRQRKTQTADDEETILGLHDDFRLWLEEQPGPREGPIFLQLAGRPTSGARGLSTDFSKIMAKAQIESPKIRPQQGKGRSVRALTFHSFRHATASAVFKSKVVEQSVKAQTAHGRGGTHRVYLHADLDVVRAATASIPPIPRL